MNKNTKTLITQDIYIRGHGIFRDIDMCGEIPNDIKRDPKKPYIYADDLSPCTKLFFYGPSGYQIAGDLADSIISNSGDTSTTTLSSFNNEEPLYNLTPSVVSSTVQDPKVPTPHAIFSKEGWSGVSAFYYHPQENAVLNYDIGHDKKDLSNPSKARTVWTAIIPITRRYHNGTWELKKEQPIALSENHCSSLYAVIQKYESQFTDKFGGNYEIRIHWTLCRSYARDNLNDTDNGYNNYHTSNHSNYFLSNGKLTPPKVTPELNNTLARAWGVKHN